MMTEVGAVYFSPEEAQRLREYLLKGGFLWADDFWGTYAWENWAAEFGKVLPPLNTRCAICRAIIRCSARSSPSSACPRFRRSTAGPPPAARRSGGQDSATPHAFGVADG